MERTIFKKKKEFGEATEQAIIIGLVNHTEYITAIRDIWDMSLIESDPAKFMAQICISFYDTYKEAPKNKFHELFFKEIKVHPSDKVMTWYEELCGVDDGLRITLNAEQAKEFNLQYLVDGTRVRFARRHFEIHTEQVNNLYALNRAEEAKELSRAYKPLEFGDASKIDNYMWTVDEIRSHNKPKPEILMKPWLREGQFTFLYGNYGVGKSLLAMNIAYLLGMEDFNREVCDIERWSVRNPTGCVYVDGELGEVELEERFSKFSWLGEQRKDRQTKFFSRPEYQMETQDSFLLSSRENQLQIIQWLKEHPKYKLVVLDSISTLFGLENENDNSEWNNKINPFLMDLRALNVAGIILHHSGKDGKRGLRGASAMGNTASNIFFLYNNPNKNNTEGEAWFTITAGDKQRAGGFSFKAFTIHYFQDSSFTNTEWTTNQLKDRFGSKEENRNDIPVKEYLNDSQVRIISRSFLKHKGMPQESQVMVAKVMGTTQATVSHAITRGKELGYILPDGSPSPLWNKRYGDVVVEENFGMDEL